MTAPNKLAIINVIEDFIELKKNIYQIITVLKYLAETICKSYLEKHILSMCVLFA